MATKYLVATGANGTTTFATIVDWLNSIPDTLTEPEHLEVADAQFDLTANATIIGSILTFKTASAANYIRIYAPLANRSPGIPRAVSGKGACFTTTGGTLTLSVGQPFFRMEGIELYQSGTGNALGFLSSYPAGNDIRIQNCLIHDAAAGGAYTINGNGPGLNLDLSGTIIYGNQRTIDTRGAANVTGANVVAWRHAAQLGFVSGSELNLKNSYSGHTGGAADDFWSGGAPTGNNNASSDTSATARFPTGSINNVAGADVFISVTPGAENFNLKDGANVLVDAGVTVAGRTTDARGTPVPQGSAPDISALERVVVVAATPPTATRNTRVFNGQSVIYTFSTTGDPTSGSFTLTATGGGGVTQGPKALTIDNATDTATVQFNAVPAGTYTEAGIVTNGGAPVDIAGLDSFTIQAIGGNPVADDSSEPPAATEPSAPTNVVATAGNGSVSVTCDVPSNGGSAITSYLVVASTGETASSPTLPVTITMPNGTAATFQMRAVNAVGQSSLSAASNSVTPTAPPVSTAPGAPVIGTAVAGNGYVDVYFTAPSSNGGAAITGYTATLSTGETASGGSSPIRVTAANGAARTATVTATNSVGTGAASAVSNSVTPTAPVTAPAATISVALVDPVGTPAAGATGLKWAWFDEVTPDLFGAPTDQGSAELTDGSGVLTISLPNSIRTSGQVGWLIVTNSNGSTSMLHKAFSGPVEVD